MRRLGALGIVFTALLILLGGCGRGTQDSEKQEGGAKKVQVVEAERVSIEQKRSFAGTARAAETIPLSFEVDGRIRSIAVQMGQRIEAGEGLARLNCTDYRLEAQRRQSGVDRAEAVLDQARSDYRRIQNLYQKDHASRSELDRARAEYRSAKAGLSEAKKALELARDKVEDCVLNTDRAGRISRVPAEEQQNVRAGQTVAVLSVVDRMQLRVFVPEDVIARIQPGDRAEATFRTLSQEIFPARVDEVGVEAAKSTTYPVRLNLEREPEGLRPGMVGRAVFRFPARSRLALPPSSVLGREEDKAWVFVVDPETGTAKKCSVEVGQLTEQGLVLRSGLREGELVVVRGMSRLEPGQKVEIERQ
ncbi:MAG: efflux RND transporter periplasmic adaptor subunit [Desulfohalobiaceae bacterium]